jgi:alpha-1,6-mannosyltransferase
MLGDATHLPRRGAQVFAAAAAVVALEILFWRLHQLGNLKIFVTPAIAICLGAGVIYFIALFALEHTRECRVAFWLILAGGLLFRLTLLPLAPTLSDDLYRYRWDGRVQLAGWNPYAIAPDDARLAALHEPGEPRFPAQELPAIYPPLAELTFRAAAAVFHSPVAFKFPMFAADILAMGLLAFWFRSHGDGNFRVAIYAWNPLVIVEFAGSGHSDALAIAAIVAAFVIIRWRPALSTMLLAVGALLKSFPLLFFPAWLRHMGFPRRRAAWWGLAGALALMALCFWPYRGALGQLRGNMAYYESRWQNNNASLYVILLHLTRSDVWAGRIGAAVAALVSLWAAKRRLPPERAAFMIVGAILLFSPNAYSWYFTWMVPWLCFFPNPAWLLLTILQFLSYHVLIRYQILGVWHFEPRFILLTYLPFYLLLASQWLYRKFCPE